MSNLDFRPGQPDDAVANVPEGQPIIAINLLKFREHADYPGEDSSLSGVEAYGIYATNARPHMAEHGAELLSMEPVLATVIGPPEENWDTVLLVRYPSMAAFAAMTTSPGYATAARHRAAALADTRLTIIRDFTV